jgi:DnaD/phage-associated family protein
MNFKRERIKEFYLRDTQVENVFIAEYMVDAEGDFIKVYLTALMYADTDEMSNSLIARHLSMTEEDVLRAWNYWEEKGVIRKQYTDPHDRFHYTVEFLNLKERLYGPSHDSAVVQDNESKIGELGPEMDDEVFRDIITHIEDITGRLIEGREPEAVVAWLYEDGLEPELITFAYRYCSEKRGQNRFSYISAVIREWKNKGIRTMADAEKYLDDTDMRRNQYKRIMQALGFYRNPTEAEQTMMNRWFDEMGFGMDKVLEACSRTTGISNPNLNYLNGILNNWYTGTGNSTAKPAAVKKTGTKNAVALVNKLYEDIRRKNETIRDERKKAVYSSIPEMEAIESELRRVSMDLSRAAFSKGTKGGISADALKNRIKDLEAEKAYLLTENGFPPDYLELQYECKKCSDTGILDNGERCSCFSEKLKQFI